MRLVHSIVLFCVTTALADDDGCSVRYRKSWYSLTQQEQQLYITGFQQIRNNGALSMLTSSYSQATPHTLDPSLFFSIHEHLVYEAENAIRSLGGRYACFAMPYWDFSMDSSMEHDAPIFKTGLGGDGNIDNHYCIESSSFNWMDYQINCAQTDSICCLRRSVSTTRTLPSSIEIAFAIQSNPDFESFTRWIQRFNDYIRAFICAEDQCPMSNASASEDPIFFLLSSFLGYIHGLWSDCNDYDLYLEPNQAIDAVLNDLFYDLNDAIWSTRAVRGSYDISMLDIQYDLGSFWTLSKLDTWCDARRNNEWFVRSNSGDGDSYETNPVNAYIDKTWSVLDHSGLNEADKFKAASALTCDFVRRTSLNSCFNSDVMEHHNNDMCDDMSSDELMQLSLSDLYDYVASTDINDDGCLMRIRSDTWAYSKDNIVLKQALCNGEFDYQCNVWSGEGYDGLDDVSGILSDESSETQYIDPSSTADFLAFDTSLWSVLVWCGMFIFVFMICCYMFTVKKDFETEMIYKKHRKTAHVAIYGAVAQV